MQSAEFAICAGGLLHLAFERARARRWLLRRRWPFSRSRFSATSFSSPPAGPRWSSFRCWCSSTARGDLAGKDCSARLAAVPSLAAALWATSPYLRQRVARCSPQTEAFENQERRSRRRANGSCSGRSRFASSPSAPLIGHGTGSITEMFRRSAVGQAGVRGEVSTNPHNQTFAVGIQLGLVGHAVLWAMWIAHLLLFRGGRAGGVDRPRGRDRRTSSARCSIRSCSISPRAGSMSSASASPPA